MQILTNTVQALIKFSILVFLISTTGCKLSDITDSAKALDGSNIPPDKIESKEGARWVYLGAVTKFNKNLGSQIQVVSSFTDELALLPTYSQIGGDARVNLNQSQADPYIVVSAAPSQAARVQLEQAIYLLDNYYDESGNAMKAHAYALLGLTYAMIADVFCSGYAVSDSRWGGEFIPGGALSTDSLYKRAIAAANEGLKIQIDSAPLTSLLKGVKARALNSLGLYKDANDLVTEFTSGLIPGEIFIPLSSADSSGIVFPTIDLTPSRYTIVNQKGSNGLVWISSDPMLQDMRVPLRTGPNGVNIVPVNTDYSYNNRRIPYFGMAEARLIEAEYHLNTGDITEFMKRINAVRSMYKVRSGAQVPDTTDPQTLEGRIDLLFRERAYTLYLTGRRMGDLRSLTRRYGRDPRNVWPIGLSEGLTTLEYGDNYVFVPEIQGMGDEAVNNPKYKGCESYEP